MDLTFLTLRPVLVFLAVLGGCALAVAVAVRVLDPRPRRRWVGVLYAVFPVAVVAAGVAGFTMPRYHLLLGEHYLKRADFPAAIDHLSKARELAYPAGGAGFFSRLRASVVKRAIASWGGKLELDTALGLAYAQTQKCDQARPLLDGVIDKARATRSAGRLAHALFLYAGCEMKAGRAESAKKALMEALLIDGKYMERARGRASLAPLVDSLFGAQEL
jgi:tetratricopeptide (TPR) repeat protein